MTATSLTNIIELPVPPKLRTSVEAVTPETAKRWLDMNSSNRVLRKHNLVPEYARTMANGNWHFTAEPIQFDQNGRLINGQHRLHAVVMSGCTITFLIVRNLDTEAQKFIDSGAKRTVADALTFNGHNTDAKDVAAIARACVMFRDDGRRPTRDEIIEYAEINADELVAAADHARPCRAKLRNGIAIYGVAFVMCARIDEDDARYFFEHLASAEDLSAGSPILALRNRCIDGLETGRFEGAIYRNVALFFKCWNAFRDNRSITVLRFGRTENFPEPK